jgi:PAS domain S-box-containing protein
MRIKNLIVLSTLGVGLIVIVAFIFAARPVNHDRTYVIGWVASPPDEVPTESGEPTGFSVELVREAARRRQIRLKWVEHPESSEAALRSKAVDLWPMMIITEERKKFFYLTDPYQEDEYALYVNEKSAFMKATDFKGQTISSESIPIDLKLLREYFPESLLLPKASLADAIRSVCDGEAQAFFDDHLTVFGLLLKNPPCPSRSFRMIPIQNLKIEFALGATLESRGAADAIRDEIGVMGRDGSLEKIVSAWSPAASQELLTLTKLQQSKSHLREYKLGLASVATLFVLALCSAAGYRRQRTKAQAYSQALGAAERNVRLVADSLTEMVVAFDTQEKLIYANSGAEALTGYGLGELRAGTALSWVHPEDRPHVRELWGKVLNHHAAEQVVYRLITKDGTVKWVAGIWGPLVDEAGHCVGIRGTCQDITERVLTERLLEETNRKFRTIVEEIAERKRAEQALRESEERFRHVADAAPVMIWVYDVNKLCTFVNKPWLAFLRGEATQVNGSGWPDCVHPEDTNRCLTTYASSFDARCSFQIEYRARRSDGEYRWLLDNGTPLYHGDEFTGYIGSRIDITEQKSIEERLRISEERLKNAERLAHVGNWQWDITANRMFWSEEMLRIFAQSQDYAPTFEEFLKTLMPKDRDRVARDVSDGLKKRRGYSNEYQIVRPNGELRTISCITEVLPDKNGSPVSIFGACQDVTDARHAQQEALARQKLESVGMLATGIAHDFNNILGAVLFQADVALGELAGGNLPETELKGIRECAIRGAEIVRQLMFYSGKESDLSELVDVSKIVEEMLNLLRVSISKRATLATDLGKSLPSLRANPAQVRQVVMNLITNASEAIGDGEGVIRIKTSRVTVSPDPFQTAAEHPEAADFLRLDVSDNGCGIPSEAQARVFDPFFTTKSDGRGLGLAVVHGIVAGLGGTIRLESEVGKGTTFQIIMPCAEGGVTETNGQTSSPEQRLTVSQGTILVVEDEDPLRRPVSKMLQKTGFNVIEAADGYAALGIIRFPQKDIDILLLDITLPGAPSREVYKEAMRLRPEMKIIVTSAYSEEMAATALAEKIELFIRKPYRPGDLMDLIQRSLV